jgi:hypothetical protein
VLREPTAAPATKILCGRDGRRRCYRARVSHPPAIGDNDGRPDSEQPTTPAAAHDAIVPCLLAIELSKKSWIVAVNTPLSEKIGRYTLKGCDWKGLLELIEKIRARVARELNRPVEIILCYEAGYDGFWLHRLLEAQIEPLDCQIRNSDVR